MRVMTQLKRQYTGLLIAGLILLLWSLNLFYGLNINLSFKSPLTYILLIIQTHLFTGLFITAHDAMHRTVSANKRINHYVGKICTTLFMFNSYDTLYKKHHEHHKYVATGNDPDFQESNFFLWYVSFLRQYFSFRQFFLIAFTSSILLILFPFENQLMFWIIPSLLSSLQLFYFGTYLPHRNKPDNKHSSRSQRKNHFYAFLTCYFFGYHYEHHDSPGTPWWRLHAKKT